MARFDGKTALVTGAASGIGAAIALQLAAEGAQVMMMDISTDGVEAVAKEAANRGGTVATTVTSITDDAGVEAAVAETVERFGGLDSAFNVAGSATLGKLTDIDVDEWSGIVDLLLKGTFLVTRYAARAMQGGGRGGAIVNISSLNAHVPLYGGSSYSAGKAGVENFTKSAALELGADGIRVNTILPGLIKTPMTKGFMDADEIHQDFVRRITLGRAGRPEEIAGPALFLASDEASYVTGTSLVVDGGWENTNYPDLKPIVG